MISALALIARIPSLRAMTITLFLTGFTYASTVPYLSVVAVHELGMSNTMLSATIFLFALANLVAGVGMAIFSDINRNYRTLILCTCMSGIAGYGTIFLAPSIPVFFLIGITLVPLCNSSYALIFSAIRTRSNHEVPEQATQIGTGIRAIYSGSWVLVPGIVAFALSGSSSMIGAWGFASLACIASLAVTFLFMPGERMAAGPERITLRASLQELTQPRILLRVIAMALVTGGHRLSGILAPLLLVASPGGHTTDVGIIAGCVAALEIPFMLLWGSLKGPQAPVRALTFGAVIFAFYFLLLGFAHSRWHFYALILPSSLGASAIIAMPMAYFHELLIDRPGLGASLNQLTSFMANGVSALAFSVGAALFGYSGTAFLGMALLVAGTAYLIIISRYDRA